MTLLFFTSLALVAISGGRRALRLFNLRYSNRLEEWVFASAMGFGLLGYVVLITGLFRILYAGVWWVLIALGLWFFRSEIRALIWRAWRGIQEESQFQGRAVRAVSFWCFLASTGALGILTALPPYGSDPLCYHLGLPKIFVERHTITYLTFTVNSLFPFLMEMLYTLGLLLRGPMLAQLFHWSFGVLAALATVSLAAPFVGTKLRWLPGIILLWTPGIFHQMPVAATDVALAAFTLVGFTALLRGFEREKKAWFILSGIFFGFALSVKLIALLYVAAAACWWILMIFIEKKPLRSHIVLATFWCAAILLFSGIWYLRSYLYLGNPVYPYFSKKVSGIEVGYNLAKHGRGKGILDFLFVPWNLTMSPESFGGRGNQWGPIFLAFLPGIFFVSRKNRKQLFQITLYAFLAGCFWFLGPQNQRFLFPVTPFLCLFVSRVIREWGIKSKDWLSRAFALTFLVVLGFQGLVSARYVSELAPHTLTAARRERFLAQEERSYEAAKWVNGETKSSDRILSQEIRVFYFVPEMVREDAFRRQTEYLTQFSTPEARLEFLKKEGVTHLLTLDGDSFSGTPRLLEEIGLQSVPQKWLKLVGEIKAVYLGKSVRYRLYQLVHS